MTHANKANNSHEGLFFAYTPAVVNNRRSLTLGREKFRSGAILRARPRPVTMTARAAEAATCIMIVGGLFSATC